MDRFLVLFADPMCAWCYGFGPELDDLLRRNPGLRLDIVMGGLRTGHREAMTPALRERLTDPWDMVRRECGLPITPAALERPGFVYDTEPACRAVVAVRMMEPEKALAYLHRVQSAFHAEGHDVTSPAVLAELAESLGIDRAAFFARFGSDSTRSETTLDFSTAREMGVNGFPTLAAGYPNKQFFLVTSGYATSATLAERLARLDAIAAQGRVPLPHELAATGDD
jgi:putative protein-disulfide isomerase